MEDGTITLVGATTENPSFELNAALLSRARVLIFRPLDRGGDRAAARSRRSGRAKAAAARPRGARGLAAHGGWRRPRSPDARRGDLARRAARRDASTRPAAEVVQRRAPIYDKSQDGHYNLISALHKAVRGSDPDAALYYFARMLDAGEDPLFIARRVVRMAVEDIGMADPQALVVAMPPRMPTTFWAAPRVNSPRQCGLYVATAPKSNAAYLASRPPAARQEGGSLMPPKMILNAPTQLMRERVRRQVSL